MTELEKDILRYFRKAAHPGKQIKIIAELLAQEIEVVIKVLKKYDRIPANITKKNYLKMKRNISEEERWYIIGSFEDSRSVADKLRLPVETVLEIRRTAAQREKRSGGRKDR